MRIEAQNLGKRFNREWVFKNFNFTFSGGNQYVILGPNGSGKSTMLQILTGMMPSSIGSIQYFNEDIKIESSEIYKEIAVCAPYLDLIDEFTLDEMIEFHFKFKKCRVGIEKFINELGLSESADKLVGSFSSGMK